MEEPRNSALASPPLEQAYPTAIPASPYSALEPPDSEELDSLAGLVALDTLVGLVVLDILADLAQVMRSSG